MALRLADHQFPVDCVIPVPLYPQRLRQRGYNQAELLAERIAVGNWLPLYSQVVGRIRDTRPQAGLSGGQRRNNVKQAFAVFEPTLIRGKTILLVDDIYTTGATINELARVLLRSGASKVYGYCLAVDANDHDLEVGDT